MIMSANEVETKEQIKLPEMKINHNILIHIYIFRFRHGVVAVHQQMVLICCQLETRMGMMFV